MTMNTGSTFGDNTDRTSDDLTPAQLGVGGAESSPGTSGGAMSGGQSGTNIEQARQKAGNAAQELKGAASKATATVSDATRRTAAQAKDKAGQLVGQATDQAKQLTQQLTEQATQQGATFFNDQKSRAAGSLGGIASALRCAATTLHAEHDKNLGAYTDSLADGVENAASYLRDADPRQLMNDAGSFARRRPEWVLGGAFIAGLALVRFLKASRSDNADAQYDMGGAQYDQMGGRPMGMDYATSDDFMESDDDDLVSRYRAGEHPGIGGTSSDAGPDVELQMGARDFARTDVARIEDTSPDVAITTPAVVPDATGTHADISLNPDAAKNNDANRTSNPSTGLTL